MTSRSQEAEGSQQENIAPALPSTDCSEVQWFLMTFLEPWERVAVFSCGAVACSENNPFEPF